MASKLIRVIGITGIIFGVAAIFVSILAEWLGIDSEAGFSLNRLLLIINGVCFFVAGFIVVISNPKKWTFVTEFGLLTLVAISIVIHSLIPFIAPQFSRIGNDADGYTKYALYLANQKAVFSPYDFFRKGDNNSHLVRLSIAVSPDDQKIASATGYGTVCLWDLQGNPIGQPFQCHEGSVTSVAFGKDGKMIASGGTDGTVRLWDLHGKPIGQTFRGHEGPVTSIAFGKEGKVLASGGMDGTIRLWDLQGNPIGQTFRGHRGSVTCVVFDMEGKKIASGSMDNTVCLWDLQGNLIEQTFRGHEESVTSVAFGKDGKMIASASIDGRIRLWDLEGNIIGRPFGYSVVVESIAFGLDGHTIVSGGRDGTVRLWNLQGNPIGQPFRGHEGSVTSVAFGENGKMIASASEDGTIRLWDIQGTPIGIPYHVHEGITLSKGPYIFPFLPDYFRQPGYPLILSGFMHLTGQYSAGAAEICQPVILALIVVFSIRWVRKRFGLLCAITLGVLFMFPFNYLVTISSYDFADFFVSILSFVAGVLLYKIVLSKNKYRYYFFTWFVVTFFAAGIKTSTCIFLILLCLSIFNVLCVGKLSKQSWAVRYNFTCVSKRLAFIVLSTIIVNLIHVYISPGAAKFNESGVFALCYQIPAPKNKDILLDKINRMQELVNERNRFSENIYSGSDLITAHGSWPLMYEYLPVLGHRQKAIVDLEHKQVLQISEQEVKQGAFSLIKTNPFPFIVFGLKHAIKDYKNLFQFSEFGRRCFLFDVFCMALFFVGIFKLYRKCPLVTTSILVAYIAFFIFLSLVSIPAIRLLMPFAGFYYIALVVGIVATASRISQTLFKTEY